MTGANGAPSESRSYNSIGQMTQLTAGSNSIVYNYSATQNNGKIVSEQDIVSGETVTYTYDSLNRLASATSSDNPGWGQSFGYDGFGNLTTQTVTKGTAPSLNVTYNAATNRRTTDCADANGNLGAAPSCSENYTYDVANRITAVSGASYSYAPNNQRVFKGSELTYYGATGQKLTTYSLGIYFKDWTWESMSPSATSTGTYYYFGGKLVKNKDGYVTPDRLGSIGKYFPYGQERPSATANNKEKFATYYRDSETGLDYANNRYHQPGHGRFLTMDPSGSANTAVPNSWNQYAYAGGDAINNNDPSGLWASSACLSNPWACIGGFDVIGVGDDSCSTAAFFSDGAFVGFGQTICIVSVPGPLNYWQPAPEPQGVGGGGSPPAWSPSAIPAEACSGNMILTGTCDGAPELASAVFGRGLSRSFARVGIPWYIAVQGIGRIGETIVQNIINLPKNTGDRIANTLSGINRIPDFWDNSTRTIYEVKFISGEVRYTQQIRDMVDWAFKNNFKFQLWIYEEAEISPAIQELERKGVLTVHRFGLF